MNESQTILTNPVGNKGGMFIDCECGDTAYRSNFTIEGSGWLYYCFNCKRYSDNNGNLITTEDEKRKRSWW